MRLTKDSNGKLVVKLTKEDWINIGKKTQWLKEVIAKGTYSEENKDYYRELIQ